MDDLAYQLAKFGAWSVPVLLVIVGVLAITKGHNWAGGSLIGSGIVGLTWNFLFLPASVIAGQPRVLKPEVVLYEDAPLGFFLFHLLPPAAGVLLLLGIALLVFRPST